MLQSLSKLAPPKWSFSYPRLNYCCKGTDLPRRRDLTLQNASFTLEVPNCKAAVIFLFVVTCSPEPVTSPLVAAQCSRFNTQQLRWPSVPHSPITIAHLLLKWVLIPGFTLTAYWKALQSIRIMYKRWATLLFFSWVGSVLMVLRDVSSLS